MTEVARNESNLKAFLTPIFAQLDSDRRLLGSPSYASSYPHDSLFLRVPETFKTLYEAQELLVRVTNLTIRHLKYLHIGTASSDSGNGVQKIWQWRTSFDKWLPEYLAHAPDADIPSLLVLQMWKTAICCILEAEFEQEEMAWDAMSSDFRLVIDCGELFMALNADPVDSQWSHPDSDVAQPVSILPRHSSTVHQEVQVKQEAIADTQGVQCGYTRRTIWSVASCFTRQVWG